MKRLTTNKDVSEMGMFELAHNSCYCKDGVARYRDFENDMDARDLARELALSLTDIELSRDNECFDEEMLENLQYDITKEPIGLIALFYRNLWAMADLRERLKEYEDLEEQGLLLRLPVPIGTTIYKFEPLAKGTERYIKTTITGYEVFGDSIWFTFANGLGRNIEDFGKYVFLTQAEAEHKLKAGGTE